MNNPPWYRGKLNVLQIGFILTVLTALTVFGIIIIAYAWYDAHPYQKETINGQECVVFMETSVVECPLPSDR